MKYKKDMLVIILLAFMLGIAIQITRVLKQVGL